MKPQSKFRNPIDSLKMGTGWLKASEVIG